MRLMSHVTDVVAPTFGGPQELGWGVAADPGRHRAHAVARVRGRRPARVRGVTPPRYVHPVPMVPGTVYEVTLSLWNTSYVFNVGHKVHRAAAG